MASTPSSTNRHKPSGEDTPPGNRHAIPTIAIGSSTDTTDTEARPAAAPGSSPTPSRSCHTCPSTNAPNAAGVG